MGKVLIIDPAKCLGCHSCEVACSTRNEGKTAIGLSRIKIISFLKEAFFFPSVCQQCEKPYCSLLCPSNALKKNINTGVVELDESRCTGCKICLIACPFGSLTFSTNVCAKCNLCDGDPICVKVCQWDALTFGEADDSGSSNRIRVANKFFEVHKEEIPLTST